MNVTRDVIDDLLPVYFSGEASADTSRLVEDFFRQNPAFEVEARRSAQIVRSLTEAPTGRADSSAELAALRRAKGILLRQRILMALALTFSLNAITLSFSFEISGGRLRLHWLTLPGQPAAVVVLGLVSVGLWIAYARTSRRIASQILA